MNHYERLKVSPDAPPEVIRAAYRALANKLHPDRQGADTGLQHAMHEDMAALNNAYEVLIDPKLRQDYDAILPPAHALTSEAVATPGHQGRVDMDWLPPQPAKAQVFWRPSRPLVMVGSAVVALMVASGGVAMWRMYSQQQMEQALSAQYVRGAAQPSAPEAIRSGTEPATGAARRRPTVQELARMSDEELLRVLPTLDGDGGKIQPVVQASRSAAMANVNHPLDGKPINLRADTHLVDPLAAPTQGRTGP